MKKKATKDQYLEESKDWEVDRRKRDRRSVKAAWSLTAVALVLAILAVGAVAALMPLKSTEPFLVRVDKTTGETDIVTAVSGVQELTHNQALDRYWIAKYVRLREGYFFPTVQRDFKLVMLMSASTAAQEYAQYMNPKKNPQSPVIRYRGSLEMSTDITSISFIDDGTALVRFEKVFDPANEPARSSSWVATIEYKYLPQRPLSGEQRLKNPLGFTVGRYRVTQEVVGGGQ